MRRLARDEWEWILYIAPVIIGFLIWAWFAKLDELYVSLTVLFAVTFYSLVWWTSTHKPGMLRLQLSVPCYSLGWISMVIILSFQTNLEIGLPALAVSLFAGFYGITYVATYDFSRMKGPVFSRLNRLSALGITLSSGGWFFLLATAVATSSSIVDVFQEASLASLTGRAAVIFGVLLVSLAVTSARRNYG